MSMVCRSPQLLGFKTSWGRLFLSAVFAVFMLVAFWQVLNTRYQPCIPRLAVECLNWNFGILDKWDHQVELGNTYAFYARNMVLRKDGEKIVKRFAAGAFDEVVIDPNENIKVNGEVKAHGLQLAAKLGKERDFFVGKSVLEPGEYFGLGETWESFDSRYWGTINEDQVFGRLYILL